MTKITVKLEAVRKHPYARHVHLPGDRYEASVKDAKVLIATGRAKRAAIMQPAVSVRDLRPSTEPKGEPGSESKRTYKRRDMKAEE